MKLFLLFFFVSSFAIVIGEEEKVLIEVVESSTNGRRINPKDVINHERTTLNVANQERTTTHFNSEESSTSSATTTEASKNTTESLLEDVENVAKDAFQLVLKGLFGIIHKISHIVLDEKQKNGTTTTTTTTTAIPTTDNSDVTIVVKHHSTTPEFIPAATIDNRHDDEVIKVLPIEEKNHKHSPNTTPEPLK